MKKNNFSRPKKWRIVLLFSTFFLLSFISKAAPPTANAPLDIAGNYFTCYEYNSSSKYIDLVIPFYDDTESDRFITEAYLQYSTDGKTYLNLVKLNNQSQSRAYWYWLKLAKIDPSSNIKTYTNSNSWVDVSTSSISYKYTKESGTKDKDGATYARVRWYYENAINNKSVKFRIAGSIGGDNVGGETRSIQWELFGSSNKPIVVGNPLHTPTITSTNIGADGILTLNFNVTGYTEHDDVGSSDQGVYFVESAYYNSYYSSNHHYSNHPADFVIKPASEGKFTYKQKLSRKIYEEGDVLSVASWRNDNYKQSTIATVDGIYKKGEDYALLPYPQPYDLSISNEGNGKIMLKWKMNKQTGNVKTDGFKIRWCVNNVNVWTELSQTVSYDKSKDEYSATFDYPEQNVGNKQYWYQIKREGMNWDAKLNDNTNLNPWVSVILNTDYISITGISASAKADSVEIRWKTTEGMTGEYWYYKLSTTGNDSRIVKDNISLLDSAKVVDKSILPCTPTTYKLELYKRDSGAGNGTLISSATTTSPVMIDGTEKGGITKLSVSKGYYNDRINIVWETSNDANYTKYSIVRRLLNNQSAAEEEIYQIENTRTLYSYDDKTAIPGQYYEYSIMGWIKCDDNMNPSERLSSIGFSQPYGIVSGRISYEGSNAVSGVTVVAEGQSSYINKSIELRAGQKTYTETPYTVNMLNPYEFSFQAWIKPQGNINRSLFTAWGKYNIYLDNTGKVYFEYFHNNKISNSLYHSQFISSKTIDNDIYQHFSFTYKADTLNKNVSVKIYLNGELYEEKTSGGVVSDNSSEELFGYPSAGIGFPDEDKIASWLGDASKYIYIGKGGGYDNFFDGYMDEARFWSRALPDEEIKGNFDRYISGQEDGLELYYRFDEFDTSEEVFDISCKNGVFNGRDGIIYGGNNSRRSSTEIPSTEQLAIKATTDKNGHYLINTIPYMGTGTQYTITPMLGVHQFNPSDKPLFFNNTSSTQNNVDFIDVSSFKVSGRVIYEGGNYPVEGVQFKIDDRIVVNSAGLPITTDYNGEFTISVPIGIHEVKVEKSGHVFLNGGKLINEETRENLNYNTDLSDISFFDQTRVKLIGHIVGGKREDSKTAAFGYRINNIGADELKLTANKTNYLLSGDKVTPIRTDTIFLHNTGEWNKSDALSQDTTRMTVNGSEITIHVSPQTGEYVAWVYPELFEIGDIKMNGNEIIYERKELLDLRNAPVTDNTALKTSVRTWTDSTFVQASGTQQAHWKKFEVSDTVYYHYEWGYYYQAIPSYTIQQVNIDDNNKVLNYFGEKELIVDERTTIPFVIEENGTINYNFNDRPVFIQGTRYRFFLKAFEEYRNTLKGKTDIMPVEGGTVSITPDMALESDNQFITLDSIGEGYFDMIGGEPDLTTGEKSLSTTINIDGIGYYPVNLPEYGTLSAYLLGGKSTGTDFMTAASDVVDLVLHDPPGSESYAYIEKGSTRVETTTIELSDGLYQEADVNVLLGTDNYVLAGIGLLSGGKTSVDHKVGVHDEVEQNWFDNKTYTTTTTFTDKIETSSSDGYVGHGGDVFVGTGTNILYGLLNSITAKKTDQFQNDKRLLTSKDGQYALGKTVNFAVGASFGTSYYYTESEIEHIMIPKWESAKRSVLLSSLGNILTDTLTTPIYVSKLSSEDINYAKPNTDEVFNGEEPVTDYARDFISGPSYTIYFPKGFLNKWKEGMTVESQAEHGTLQFTDTIEYYTQKIKDWENLLAGNEKNKVNAYGKMDGNLSFGGGVTIEKNNTLIKDTVSAKGTTISSKLLVQGETGFNIFGAGLEVKNKTGWVRDENDYTEITNTYGSTTGFVLKESSSWDQLTVDYGRDPIHNTYVFRTRGGRTSCPYEGEQKTKYHEPGKHILSEATTQIEVPKITVDNGVYRVQVPSDRAANFNLVLTNESESENDGIFNLLIDDTTNPYGAILRMDGEIISDSRPILIPYGKKLEKTLTIEKGPNVDNYEEIRIILASDCQYGLTDFIEDLYDYVDLSVEFTPSCSDVAILSPKENWIINAATMDTMQIEIGNFDRNYTNFDHIELQYRAKSSPDWKTVHSFYVDNTRFENAQTTFKSMITDATIKYLWDMSSLYDGEYEIRGYSACQTTNGVLISECYSDAVAGYKDMQRPTALGYPSPANGILNAGDEISILFNEDIQSGALVKDNFTITGILNADQLSEPNVGLSFDGTGSASTELAIYTDGSFSIETWFSRNAGSEGSLFAYGETDNNLSLAFDAAGHAVLKIGNDTYTSNAVIANDNTWKYISLSCDRNAKTVSVFAFQGSDPAIKLFENEKLINLPPTQGRLYVGNSPDGNGFRGAVALVHFYGTIRSAGEAASSMYVVKSGIEPNLIGYWELNEGEGSVAKDKARSRNLALNTGWYIYPSGRSLAFNGTNQFGGIPSGTFPFRTYDDFTIEFWFKASNQQNTTMFTCGEALYIGFDADRKLTLSSTNEKYILSNTDLQDEQWHHFALSVKRTGSINTLIDGKATSAFNHTILPGTIAGAYYYLGAKYSAETAKASEFFKGNIDEIRVWNSALTSDFITLNKNNKLRGTELGLKAYYPFETYIKQSNGLVTVSSNLNDMFNNELKVWNLTQTDNLGVSMQDCRPVKNVSFNFTASNNKVVLDLTEEDYKLEGVVLSISATGIKDMRDNASNTISWTAYVNRNPLRWDTDAVDLLINSGENASFTAIITNNAGDYTDFVIGNLPEWLTVDVLQGTLNPLASKTLKFTVAGGTNIGNYETAISLTGISGISSLLPVTLKVTGERPDWSVNPSDFSSTMSIVGRITIEDLPQEDEDDLLGAFIEDLCIGVVSPKYVKSYNAYYVFMNVYGNDEHEAKKVNFKLWDASTGRIYSKIDALQNGENHNILFAGGETKYTSIASPVVFNAQNVVELQIPLYEGWSWISTNVESKESDLLTQFKEQLNDNCVELKSQTNYLEAFNQNNVVKWIGNLDKLSIEEAYLTKVRKTQVLNMAGEPVDVANTKLSLNNGWNWIGYLPQFSAYVSDALAGIDAKEDDQIKSQSGGFSVYSENNGWIGTLTYMQPGKGYMYHSGNAKQVQFVYPSESSRLRMSTGTEEVTEETKWNVDYRRFANNITLTSIALLDDVELESSRIEIGAFVGNDCRGSVILSHYPGLPHEYLGFLMVYGDSGDEIQFKMYDHESGTEYVKTSETIVFKANDKYGSAIEPYQIKFWDKVTSISEMRNNIAIYPNPASIDLHIDYKADKIDLLEIVDLSGRIIRKKINVTDKSINVSDLERGLYLLKLTFDGESAVFKFEKK